MGLSILHRDDLPLGGFAGLREHRLVTDPRVFGAHQEPGTWSGMGSFVYLADARFNPKGETRLHNHKEIDVISVMVEGRIAHQGSLEHGQGLEAYDVQAQRAGGEGFSHNEVNPDDHENRMIQIWVLPEKPGEPAGYKMYSPQWGEEIRVYGGKTDQDETLDSHTFIDVAMLRAGGKMGCGSPFMAYLTTGSGMINDDTEVKGGDLIKGESLEFEAQGECQLIVIHPEE